MEQEEVEIHCAPSLVLVSLMRQFETAALGDVIDWQQEGSREQAASLMETEAQGGGRSH